MATNKNLIKAAVLWTAALFCILISHTANFKVSDLTCELLDEPLAIDSCEPHFSWKINSKEPMAQFAYEIQVATSPSRLWGKRADLWKSGKVISADQVMVRYAGKDLTSRAQCWWRVRVWKTDKKVSKWSKAQHFGVGVIAPDSLSGEYIGAVPGEGRSALLRKSFKLSDRGRQAILYVNSYGYHEVYVNGQKVSDAVLTPAVSELRKHSLIVAYDVRKYLRKGSNELVLWTGSGWYKPTTFEAEYPGALVKAELDIFYANAHHCVVSTDASWSGRWSGYTDTGTWKAHQFGGERIDARIVPAELDKKTLDALEWSPVDVVSIEGKKVTPQSCEICTVQEVINPISVEAIDDNTWIVDFGCVINGMLELTLPSLPAGTEVKVGFTDNKSPNGRMDFTGYNYYISSGTDPDHFADKFNHHVFRYLKIENLPAMPIAIVAKRMRTDYAESVSFECSDSNMNDIFNMVKYTLDNLAFDGYMVDCANI